ncbi:hypothetical protein CF328_g8261 [Tilletia controversa]|nr:hypothetical protein CF328_g8261 [Tilletia controversa]
MEHSFNHHSPPRSAAPAADLADSPKVLVSRRDYELLREDYRSLRTENTTLRTQLHERLTHPVPAPPSSTYMSTIPARPGLTQAYTARTVAPDSASLLSAPAHHAAQRLRGLGLQAGPVRAKDLPGVDPRSPDSGAALRSAPSEIRPAPCSARFRVIRWRALRAPSKSRLRTRIYSVLRIFFTGGLRAPQNSSADSGVS